MNRYVLLWIIISTIGLVLSLYLTRESWLDLKEFSVDGRRRYALSRLIRECLRVTVHAIYLAIGIPVLNTPERFSFIVLGLMWGNMVLVINSIVDGRVRGILFDRRRGD